MAKEPSLPPNGNGTSLSDTRRQSLKTANKGAKKKKIGPAQRLFPALTLEETLPVPLAIKNINAGNPWPPAELAKAMELGAKGEKFFYLSAASRDYGLTTGSRDTPIIELTPIGRKLVYATSPEVEREATLEAFCHVQVFKR